jgi:hypothetical protein
MRAPMAYTSLVVIVETSIFTRQVNEQLTEEEYCQLQIALADNPGLGRIIKGSGGLRKIRWMLRGHGKRGGVRIIYYWAVADDRLLMLFLYPKNVRSDLTPAQIAKLRQIVEQEYP